MANRPARFKIIDLKRALRAAEQMATPHAVEIAPDGTISIVPTKARKSSLRAEVEPEEVLVF